MVKEAARVVKKKTRNLSKLKIVVKVSEKTNQLH